MNLKVAKRLSQKKSSVEIGGEHKDKRSKVDNFIDCVCADSNDLMFYNSDVFDCMCVKRDDIRSFANCRGKYGDCVYVHTYVL